MPDAELHPDLAARCKRCGFQAIEHDPYDLRCPDDEDEARIYREENA
jgi:hypothetical protein